jgi:hypothetical protein
MSQKDDSPHTPPSSESNRTPVRGKQFTSRQLAVDGKHFEDCEFDACTFVYSGGVPPNFVRCEFAAPHFVFKGAAQRTIQLMSAIYNGIDPRIIEMTFDEIRKEPRST